MRFRRLRQWPGIEDDSSAGWPGSVRGPSGGAQPPGNARGVPAGVRERLSQPCTTSNKTSGIGLGLAITADLVKLHHGLIALVGDGEVGTTFRVTLPCQQPLS